VANKLPKKPSAPIYFLLIYTLWADVTWTVYKVLRCAQRQTVVMNSVLSCIHHTSCHCHQHIVSNILSWTHRNKLGNNLVKRVLKSNSSVRSQVHYLNVQKHSLFKSLFSNENSPPIIHDSVTEAKQIPVNHKQPCCIARKVKARRRSREEFGDPWCQVGSFQYMT
jgi:hypothetical protein